MKVWEKLAEIQDNPQLINVVKYTQLYQYLGLLDEVFEQIEDDEVRNKYLELQQLVKQKGEELQNKELEENEN